MTIRKIEEIVIYESFDGGKTVYSRKSGETVRHIHHKDPEHQKEQEQAARWIKLKPIVILAEIDPTINDLLTKLEMMYALKKDQY